MIMIEYPAEKPAVKVVEGKEMIFCLVRKKWLLITPEEWVRQNFMLYLVHIKNYPVSLISVEKKIKVGEMAKRYDIVVYSREMQPLIVVECKEMNVPLSEHTLKQVLQYNIKLSSQFLIITNGTDCAAYKNDAEGFKEIQEIPAFQN